MPPQDFVTALNSLKGLDFRPEFHLTQIPAPTGIAPWSVALQAEINDTPDSDPDFYRGETKFVVLYDPDGQATWDGQFRVIIYASAPMDREMGDDPLLCEVAWSWLHDSLTKNGAEFHNINGTVTRVSNETFGGLNLNSARTELELRASWTPDNPHLTQHLLSWVDFSTSLTGLPPHLPNVHSLPRKVEKI